MTDVIVQTKAHDPPRFQPCPRCAKPAKHYSIEQLRDYIYPGAQYAKQGDGTLRWFRCVRKTCNKVIYIGTDMMLRAEPGPSTEKRRRSPRSTTSTAKTVTEAPAAVKAADPAATQTLLTCDKVVAEIQQLVENRVTLCDRYRLERQLGMGNTATVVLATDLLRHELVAAKFHWATALDDEDSEIPRERVIRTQRMQSSLNSPHALRSFALIRHDDPDMRGQRPPCFVTIEEFIEGTTLQKIIDDHDKVMKRITEGKLDRADYKPALLSECAAIQIGMQLCRALAQARDRGKIVHRDVKPENIMIREDASYPLGICAVLIDFNLARDSGSRRDTRQLFPTEESKLKALSDSKSVTLNGAFLGTPKYMSPEQAAVKRLDERSDIYSLAATLYHMVTGYPPLYDPDTGVLFHLVINKEPPLAHIAAQSLGIVVSESFSRVMAKALEKEPTRRYASAEEFEAALDSCLRPPEERKPGLFSRFFGA